MDIFLIFFLTSALTLMSRRCFQTFPHTVFSKTWSLLPEHLFRLYCLF